MRKRPFTDFNICIGWRSRVFQGRLSKWLFSVDYQSEFREVSHVEKTPPMRRMVAGITILGFYVRIDFYSFGPVLKRAAGK